MERIVDVATIITAVCVFFTMALAMVIPPRRTDRLTLALVGLLMTWGVLFTAALLQTFGYAPIPLPAWERWVIRLALNLFGIGGLVELVRAGAFRRPKGD